MLVKNHYYRVNCLMRFVLPCILSFILCLSNFPFNFLQKVNGEFVTEAVYNTRIFLNKSIDSDNKTHIQDEIEKWKLESVLHKKNVSSSGQFFIRQAQAYRSLGKASKAITIAEKALDIAHIYNDNDLQIAALENRGEAYHLQGKYRLAITDFNTALNLASKINNYDYQICLLNSLGRVYLSLAQVNYRRIQSSLEFIDNSQIDRWKAKAFDYDLIALKTLEESYELAKQRNDKQLQINSIIYSIPSISRIYQSNVVKEKLQEALMIADDLKNSDFKAYVLIEIANFLTTSPTQTNLSITSCSQSIKYEQFIMSKKLLNKAIKIARSVKSDNTLALAFGNIGHIYECRQEYQQALDFTRKAQLAAQKASNFENSLYLWNWQEGRIFKENRQLSKAILAYENAINNLEVTAKSILINSNNLQFKNHVNTELIYRQLIEIKLNLLDKSNFNLQKYDTDILSSALTSIDKLKLIEVQNYLGDESILKSIKNRNSFIKINHQTVIFCSLIFPNRTIIIASFPNGKTKLKWINVNSKTIKKEINQFRIELEKRSNLLYNPNQAQKLYNWIIAPFAKDLELSQIKTLVFINDGILRTVPMAALHDGNQFLIEKYFIANTLGLSLTDTPTINHNQFQVLSAGLTQNSIIDGQIYPALDYVDKEIYNISQLFPNSKQLLNENFTYKRLKSELQQNLYPIIHIATHAKFNYLFEDTFLIMGNNEKLNISQLDKLIRSVISDNKSVELLTLTACETAVGDEDAALSLASVAVQAGVKSTLASLWSINDAATVNLITEFYHEWYNNKVSKAEALHRSQKKLISLGGKYALPYYWAPFVLIGNWL